MTTNAKSIPGFVEVNGPDPHLARSRRLMVAHPEIRSLIGNAPSTALFIVGLVASQSLLAFALRDAPWWAILLAAYTAGAVASLGLWVLVHECTHNLVFKSTSANILLQMVANLPLVLPAVTSFRKYHLMHHRFHGDPIRDCDMPSPIETRLVGSSGIRKAVWLFSFPILLCLRVSRINHIRFVDRWFVVNVVVETAYLLSISAAAGPGGIAFLCMSGLFAVGFHPLGARNIQEHFQVRDDQETCSYYGPLNLLVFNAGYHNEHHDVMGVPWMRLPQIKAMAPEFYEALHAHKSWTALLFKFLTDPDLTLYSRVVRHPRRPN